jgi:hypothetical protein
MKPNTGNSGYSHRNLQQQKQDLEQQIETSKEEKGFDGFDQELGMSAEQAVGMQPHMGNAAVQDLMDQLSAVDSALQALEAEQSQQEEQQEDVDLETELQGQSIGGGGGSGGDSGGGPGGNPWDMQFFLGGDDDDDDIQNVIKRKRNKQRQNIYQTQNDFEEEQQPYLAEMYDMMDALPMTDQGERTGDSTFHAVEAALLDPQRLFGFSLNPDELAKRFGANDPIRTPVEIGRFLEQQNTSPYASSIAEILSGPASPLVAPQGGFSTAVARLAAISVCSEVAMGGNPAVDTVVSLSLRREVWRETVEASRVLSQRGVLNAPEICAHILRRDISKEEEVLPSPSTLGGSALEQILPFPMGFSQPFLQIKEKEQEEDPLLKLIDQALFDGTNAVEKPILLDNTAIEPAMNIANRLLSALGRTQVELAAASVALYRVKEDAQVYHILKKSDEMLRELAQGVVKAGKSLEELRNKPYADVKDQAELAVSSLGQTIPALQSLRNWGLATLAGQIGV